MPCLAPHALLLRGCFSKVLRPGKMSSTQCVMHFGQRAPGMVTCAGVSLTALAEAAQLGAVGGQAGSPLLSEAAKAAGVPCSPAQLYFLALEQVRACKAVMLSCCLNLPPPQQGCLAEWMLSHPEVPLCFPASSSLPQA